MLTVTNRNDHRHCQTQSRPYNRSSTRNNGTNQRISGYHVHNGQLYRDINYIFCVHCTVMFVWNKFLFFPIFFKNLLPRPLVSPFLFTSSYPLPRNPSLVLFRFGPKPCIFALGLVCAHLLLASHSGSKLDSLS